MAAIPPHPFLVSLTPVDTVNFCFIARRDFGKEKERIQVGAALNSSRSILSATFAPRAGDPQEVLE